MQTRSLFRRIALVGVVGAAAVLLTPGVALAAEVQNGSFETGDSTGWTIEAWPKTTEAWYINSGDVAPQSDNSIYGPPCGDYQAVFDQNGPSSAVLYQDITLDADVATLSFTHWYINQAVEGLGEASRASAFAPGGAAPSAVGDPIFASPNTLDPQFDGDNQQYRVDIMDPAADPFSVDAADVWQSVFATQPGDPGALAPKAVTVDVSAFAGQTIRLRFAAVDNVNYFNVGVDCVAVQAAVPTTTTTTEATTTTTQAVAPAVVTPRFTG